MHTMPYAIQNHVFSQSSRYGLAIRKIFQYTTVINSLCQIFFQGILRTFGEHQRIFGKNDGMIFIASLERMTF